MVTKNWYNLFKAHRASRVITNATTDWTGKVKNAGYSSSPGDWLAFRTFSVTTDAISGSGICLGAGTTPPTVDDYTLESMITSGFSCVVATSLDEDNNAVWTITINNTSKASITIGEVGYRSYGYFGENTGTAYYLYERTVLDSPITIEPGGVGQVTYTIRMNYPTA